ncbi:NADPH:quinone reductase-like Zn-dependent oxidoreductase [Pseudoduganella flava]|uniref:NADPH:quinone reductase-like Zn-dependent oxidoreductase n=1 Tax=Pseudoduganella flava TaxID=871742 RepID=A0A562Q521_9BURK|nr:NADP-dependent oxidoreductase [Pseudoduganella flava]QGZ41829.1 zinc-binding dehydrogenase [Pseudoduganella flava]TWI51839.1 NADPH:quinone reductase-like Zn-dependent oxidoreductase [Pseudoduganella flava]
MQAAVIRRLGAIADVPVEPVTEAQPGPGQVLVRIEAASVNPLDVKMIAGYMEQVFPVALPYVPGTDFAGVVVAVGPQVDAPKVGDRVAGRKDPVAGGAFARSTAAGAGTLVVIPDGMTFEQAAALPTAFGTAQQALFALGALQPDQRVLIHAGAGGVGSFAVQLAKLAGAHVTATASAGNLGLLKELGADTVLDYRADDFTRLSGYDLVLDTVGGDTTARSWQVLHAGGTLVTLVDFSIAPRDGRHGAAVFFKDATEALRQAVALFAKGQLQIVIDSAYPLAQIGAALGKVAAGHARGKVVVRMAG